MKTIMLVLGFLLIVMMFVGVMTIISHLPPSCTQSVGTITFSTGAPGCP